MTAAPANSGDFFSANPVSAGYNDQNGVDNDRGVGRYQRPTCGDSAPTGGTFGAAPVGQGHAASASPGPHHFDSASILAKQQLLYHTVSKFSGPGKETLFHTLKATLRAQMAGLPFSPIEEVNVLKVNMAGAALAVINTFHATSGAHHAVTVVTIWVELEE